jgi:hypothetical protein
MSDHKCKKRRSHYNKRFVREGKGEGEDTGKGKEMEKAKEK